MASPSIHFQIPAGRPVWILFATILFAILPLQAAEIGGVRYLSLEEVAAKLGMKSRWVERGEVMELKSAWTELRFELHQREMLLNKLRIHLGYPVASVHGKLHISESDYTHQIQPILTPQVFGIPPRIRHIVIDAGHGGTDPGAQNSPLKLREKSLTLDLTARLKLRLERAGYKVSLTRSGDTFIPLPERAKIANRLKADLFLSLHFNGSVDNKVSGVETFAYTPPFQPSSSRAKLHSSDQRRYPSNLNDPWNTLLGFYVQRSLKETLPSPDRGLKRARFTVLQDLEMPGLLIEGGFVSNAREGRNIGSAFYRDKIATAILEGLSVFQGTADRLRGNER